MKELKFKVFDSAIPKDIEEAEEGKPSGDMVNWEYVKKSSYLIDALNGKYPIVEYTTKKDKNNKEIHNADWLKWNNDFYWVNWDEFNGCWYGEPHIDNINRGILTAPSFKDCEIVGNKLVNPEIGNIIVNPEQVWNRKEWVKI